MQMTRRAMLKKRVHAQNAQQVFAGGLKQVKPSPTEEISRRSERRGAVQGTLV